MSPIENDPQSGLNGRIAAVLRGERAAQRVTFDQLATRSGLSKRTLIRLLNAERGMDISQAAGIADALGMKLSDVFAAAEQRQDPAPPEW